MDLAGIARAQRRRRAIEALEFERNREAALRDQLEELIADLEGPRLDEEAFARMAAEDVEIVRAALADAGAESFDFGEDVAEGWLADEEASDLETERQERLAEISRLEREIAACRRRQQAFARYLQALGG